MKKGEILKIYTDGAARGNPGPAASAFILVYNDKIIKQGVKYVGKTTNNQAEYLAIINGLKTAKKLHKGQLEIYSDSNLAIKQINRKWKINYPHLLKLYDKVNELIKNYEKVEFFHINRNNKFIQICDHLCNERLNEEMKDSKI